MSSLCLGVGGDEEESRVCGVRLLLLVGRNEEEEEGMVYIDDPLMVRG